MQLRLKASANRTESMLAFGRHYEVRVLSVLSVSPQGPIFASNLLKKQGVGHLPQYAKSRALSWPMVFCTNAVTVCKPMGF